MRRRIELGQYLAIRYTERLATAGIDASVCSRGDSYDIALTESVIGLFKTEVIRRQGPWRSLEDAEFATLAWVHWFNTTRLLEPLGLPSPRRVRVAALLHGEAKGDATRRARTQFTESPENSGRFRECSTLHCWLQRRTW
ncbi:MAG: transposase [Gemmatimonadetes bacterium]|nr:transposase [Gemmatimonadota bacterium]MBK6457223.1 transposase [Gemmatimonadota bacterium]MBK7830845.1 transposase [Gemmatimonadota bacterium]